ncbi:phosphoglycerate dehydrogenase [Candidatus Micrarchaeota archaeon]|nr:phosphoglycerate dehydrogenase [Candidatus Micrarchaeota archaeon]
MRILVTENISPEGLALLRNEFEVDERQVTPEQLKEILPEYDGLMVRSATKVTADVLAGANKLKAIARAGVGVDNVDVAAATRKGVLVLNAPHGNTISAAEMAVALMLSALRKVASANSSLRNGRWERSKFVGSELNSKTVGIVGLGPVGSHVAKILLGGFDCKIVVFDPYVLEHKAKALGVELAADLDSLISVSDILTIHAPLTPKTKNMISREQFSRMKDGVVVVNAARGGIINEEALLEALQSGKVSAAGIDVYSKEPPEAGSFSSKLVALPNVVATPHLGASTMEAQCNVSVCAAEQLLLALKGKQPTTAVNLPFVVDPSLQSRLQPFISLGETAGRFLSQLQEKPLEKLEVSLHGETASALSRAITVASLKGFLEKSSDVNFVNACHLAKEKGMDVSEVISAEKADYANLVKFSALDEAGNAINLSFALFTDDEPRLVSFNAFSFEARLSQKMLLIENDDVPGAVGIIGSALAGAGVNIAELHLSRSRRGGTALSLVNVDEEPSKECIDGMLKNPIRSVKVLRLK